MERQNKVFWNMQKLFYDLYKNNSIFCVIINLHWISYMLYYITQGMFFNIQNPEWLIKRTPRKELREIWLKM